MMAAMASRPRHVTGFLRHTPRRIRGRLLPIGQTAVAAVIAWYIADALLSDPLPVFASISAVISLGASYGERRQRAVQLVGGVVLGISVADLIIELIGTGAPQIGVMVLLAMSAAVLVGGGELLVTEAAVSAILLVALQDSAGPGYSPNRIFEALIGGGVGLVTASLIFPPDPRAMVDRAVQAVIAELGRTLERISESLASGDAVEAGRASVAATGIDHFMHAAHIALETSAETARFSPPRRGKRGHLDPYARSLDQIDFAVRDTRVLARHALRYLRSPMTESHEELARAIGELAGSVWELGASYDDPAHTDQARQLAVEAASRATALLERDRDLSVSEVVAQIRSTAVDLLRAAELVAGAPAHEDEVPTKELLIGEPGR